VEQRLEHWELKKIHVEVYDVKLVSPPANFVQHNQLVCGVVPHAG
jgi:hypothetical protein